MPQQSPATQQMTNLLPLPHKALNVSATVAARRLIGAILWHDTPMGPVAGRIIETEAYDQADAASHSCRGITPRTQVMFGAAGHAYVYRSYGLHWCINVVVGAVGRGAAVLLRALEPMVGLERMAQHRGISSGALLFDNQRRLTRGPGCLTQACAINGSHNGVDMMATPVGPLRLYASPTPVPKGRVVATPRIGISIEVDKPWRFILKGSPYLSGPKALNQVS